MKYARRTFAIVSTISIPHPAPMSPMEAIVNPPSRGSRLDADRPQNGGLIPCRFTQEPPTPADEKREADREQLQKAFAGFRFRRGGHGQRWTAGTGNAN